MDALNFLTLDKNEDDVKLALIAQDSVGNTPLHYSFADFAFLNLLIREMFLSEASGEQIFGAPHKSMIVLVQ